MASDHTVTLVSPACGSRKSLGELLYQPGSPYECPPQDAEEETAVQDTARRLPTPSNAHKTPGETIYRLGSPYHY